MAAPVLSVVTPAFNSDATILESVESALGQTERRIELIVVDDGSDNRVAEILKGIRDPRLAIVRHTRNRGIGAARNTGLRQARSELVAYLDADDIWDPDYVASVVPRFADPRIGLVYANAHVLGHPDGLDLYIQDPCEHPIDEFPRFAERNPIPSVTATMRTQAIRAAGGYSPRLRIIVDYDMYVRLIVAGWRFAYIDRVLAWYRWPEPTRGASWDTRATDRALLRLWATFVARHPTVPGPRYQLRMRLYREIRHLLGLDA